MPNAREPSHHAGVIVPMFRSRIGWHRKSSRRFGDEDDMSVVSLFVLDKAVENYTMLHCGLRNQAYDFGVNAGN